MKKQLINYETLLKITSAISATRDPEDVVVLTVESVKTAMDVKGCTLFLVDRKTDELKIAGSYGLSRNYLDKGPVSSLKSIAESIAAVSRGSTKRRHRLYPVRSDERP